MQQNLDMHFFYPVIYQAVAGDDFTVFAYVCDGSVRKVDMKPLLEDGGVFQVLRDAEVFRSALTVMNGTVAWDLEKNRDTTKCIDIDPFMVFESEVVDDFPVL